MEEDEKNLNAVEKDLFAKLRVLYGETRKYQELKAGFDRMCPYLTDQGKLTQMLIIHEVLELQSQRTKKSLEKNAENCRQEITVQASLEQKVIAQEKTGTNEPTKKRKFLYAAIPLAAYAILRKIFKSS
ncbi:MAG: hypothetical protein V1837_04935 [Candidatus Woesearchaeota archaeon]